MFLDFWIKLSRMIIARSVFLEKERKEVNKVVEYFDLALTALNQLWLQMVMFIPKVVVAIVIWLIGKYFIGLGASLIKKVDIKGTKIDDYLLGILSNVVLVVGKILLVLVVLDFLGVGRTVVGAIANGLTLAVAIALGLSFGRALEEDAKGVVGRFKEHLGRK